MAMNTTILSIAWSKPAKNSKILRYRWVTKCNCFTWSGLCWQARRKYNTSKMRLGLFISKQNTTVNVFRCMWKTIEWCSSPETEWMRICFMRISPTQCSKLFRQRPASWTEKSLWLMFRRTRWSRSVWTRWLHLATRTKICSCVTRYSISCGWESRTKKWIWWDTLWDSVRRFCQR